MLVGRPGEPSRPARRPRPHLSIHIAEDIKNANLDSLDSGPTRTCGWIATKNKVWKRHAEDPTNVSLKSSYSTGDQGGCRPFAQANRAGRQKA